MIILRQSLKKSYILQLDMQKHFDGALTRLADALVKANLLVGVDFGFSRAA